MASEDGSGTGTAVGPAKAAQGAAVNSVVAIKQDFQLIIWPPDGDGPLVGAILVPPMSVV